MNLKMKTLSFFLISFVIFLCNNNLYSQVAGSGLWSGRSVVDTDVMESPFCSGSLSASTTANYAFQINDTLYIGGKGTFTRYNRLENNFTTLSVPPLGFSPCSPEVVNQSFVINGIGYVFSDRSLVSYNPNTNQWSQIQGFPGLDLLDASISVVNGKAYIIGGLKPRVGTLPRESSKEVWMFDPIPKSFIKLSDMPSPGNGIMRSSALGNKIYYLNGITSFYEYNTILDQWTSKPVPKFVYQIVFGPNQYESIIGMFTFNDELYITTCVQIGNTFGNRRIFKWNNILETWSDIGISIWPTGSVFLGGTISYVPTSREVFDISSVDTRAFFRARTILSWTTKSGVIQSSEVLKESNRCINSNESLNLKYTFNAKGQFQNGNKFYLEISNADGQFLGVKLDSIQTAVTSSYIGVFRNLIPKQYLDSLKKYRVRVTSSLPKNDDDYATYLKNIITYYPDTTLKISNPIICNGSYSTISLNSKLDESYTWYKNNLLINGQTKSSINITDPGEYFAIVTNSANCSVTTRKIILISSNLPPSPIVNDVSYCISQIVDTLSANKLTNHSLNWYGQTSFGGISTNIPPIPSTLTPGSFKYYVSQKDNNTGCESSRAALTVTVNSAPSSPIVLPVSYCLGSSSSALTSAVSSGSSLFWYGTSSTGGVGSITSPIPSTSTVGVFDYYVSQKNNTSGCESSRSKLSVTINEIPSIPVVSSISYCSGSTSNALTGSITTGNSLVWYGMSSNGGVGSNTAPIPSTTTVGTFDYYVSQKGILSGCESARQKLSVIVISSPNSPSVSGISYCSGSSSVALTSTAIAGNSLIWYGLSATGGTASSNAPVPSTATAGVFDYYVSQKETSTGCESVRSKLTVTINATPSAPVVSSVSYCIGTSANALSGTSTSGNSLVWYGMSSTGGIGNSSAPTPMTASTGSFDYFVSQKSNSFGCESPRSKLLVVVNATPNAPAVSSVAYCQGITANALSTSASGVNSLIWYGTSAPGGAGVSVAPLPSTVTPGSFNYYVSQKDNTTGCESSRAALTVTVNPAPSSPVVLPVSYCFGSTSSALTSAASSGSSLLWYGASSSGGVGDVTAPIPSTSTVGIFDYYVSQKNSTSGCESPRSKLTVSINDIPTIPVVSSISYCSGSTSNALTGSITTGNSLVWYGMSSNGGVGSNTAPIPSTTTVGTFDYYVSQKGILSGCESARQKLSVIVISSPNSPSVSGISYCSGSSSVALTSTAIAGNSLIWYGLSATGGTASSNAPVPSTATAGVFDYYVSQKETSTGCESVRSKLTITINATPNAPVVSSVSYCTGTTANAISGTSTTGNSLVWYGMSSTGGIGNSSSPTPITTTAGSFDYFVSQKSNSFGCESPRSKITVSINSIPSVPIISKDNNNNLVSSSLSGNQWFVDGVLLSGVTNSNFKPVSSGNYTVQVTLNSCKSSVSNMYFYLVSNIVNFSNGDYIKTYPNPVINNIKFDFNLNGTLSLLIDLIDIKGRIILNRFPISKGSNISMKHCSPGIYFLKFYKKKGEFLYATKIIKD